MRLLVGKGRLKERCGLEPRTNIFLFQKSVKTSVDEIRVQIRFENIRYIYIYCNFSLTTEQLKNIKLINN